MKEPRDACPACDQKLHPQEMQALYRGRKIDCWHCTTPLKARSKYNLQWMSQMMIASWGLLEAFFGLGGSGLWSLAIAGAVVALFYILPPGLVVGAPWVKVVRTDAPKEPAAEV